MQSILSPISQNPINLINIFRFVEDLGYPVTTNYTAWMMEDQVAGFTKVYAKRLTFTTIQGAGHTVPEDKPAEAKKMFDNFLASL